MHALADGQVQSNLLSGRQHPLPVAEDASGEDRRDLGQALCSSEPVGCNAGAHDVDPDDGLRFRSPIEKDRSEDLRTPADRSSAVGNGWRTRKTGCR